MLAVLLVVTESQISNNNIMTNAAVWLAVNVGAFYFDASIAQVLRFYFVTRELYDEVSFSFNS